MTAYYTLVAALPHLPASHRIEQLPISAIALQRRLSFLSPKEQALLRQVELLMFPAQKGELMTDKTCEQHWRYQLAQLPEGRIKDVCMQKLELDTVLAAIRRRLSGQQSPEIYGVGRWLASIKRHWSQPWFGMENKFPLIKTLMAFAKDNQWHDIDMLASDALWQSLRRIEHLAPFSLDAVMAYRLRFTLAERYLQKSTEPSEVMDDVLAEWMAAQPIWQHLEKGLKQGGER